MGEARVVERRSERGAAKAGDVSRRAEKDRGSSARALGEGEGWQESLTRRVSFLRPQESSKHPLIGCDLAL